MGQSLASFVTPVGQEKYCVFLIYSQGKHLHFQEKVLEKSGKNIRQDVYEPCTTVHLYLITLTSKSKPSFHREQLGGTRRENGTKLN